MTRWTLGNFCAKKLGVLKENRLDEGTEGWKWVNESGKQLLDLDLFWSLEPAMKRKASKNILVIILLRLLPLVLLPLLVGALQPDADAGEGWKMILVGAACGVVISAAVPSLRIAILAVAIVTVLLLSVAYTQVGMSKKVPGTLPNKL